MITATATSTATLTATATATETEKETLCGVRNKTANRQEKQYDWAWLATGLA